ncbi:MAG: hypothetical protein QM726_01125 [Chitinophagaceae bacterium]
MTACNHRNKSLSFYYWRTSLHLDSVEKKSIYTQCNGPLYIRYFDIDLLPENGQPVPVTPLISDTSMPNMNIVPVVYIKNGVLQKLDSAGIEALLPRMHLLINHINQTLHNTPTAIQFDCDWTESTRRNYFLLLRRFKELYTQSVSATIRLHQVKYPLRTGIPPVDKGVLMYYNMGDIDTSATNSIYDASIASRYIASLKTYPLPLDIALPIFGWSQLIRDGHVVKLLNKMNFQHFQNDTNFNRVADNRYVVKTACFHGGYYFKANDIVKAEHVTESDLLEIVSQINNNSNKRIGNLILYDLDKENLVLYDKNSFQKILDHLN